jgi:hypothetical protein
LMQTTWLDACCADAIWKRSKFRGRRDSWHLHLPKCPWLTSKFFGSTPNCTTCHRMSKGLIGSSRKRFVAQL